MPLSLHAKLTSETKGKTLLKARSWVQIRRGQQSLPVSRTQCRIDIRTPGGRSGRAHTMGSERTAEADFLQGSFGTNAPSVVPCARPTPVQATSPSALHLELWQDQVALAESNSAERSVCMQFSSLLSTL